MNQWMQTDQELNRRLRLCSGLIVATIVAASGLNAQIVSFAGAMSSVGNNLNAPSGVAVDAAGNIYVADTGNGRVLKLDAYGVQTAVASGWGQPVGVAVNATGDIFVSDRAYGTLSKIPATMQSTRAPIPVASGLKQAAGVAADALGNIYVVDTGSNKVLKYRDSIYSTGVPVGGNWVQPTGVAVDGNNNVLVTDIGRVTRIASDGSSARVRCDTCADPTGVAVNRLGNVFVTNTRVGTVVEFTLPASTGRNEGYWTVPVQIAVVGTGWQTPLAIAAGKTGNLFVIDAAYASVREWQTGSVDFGNVAICAPGTICRNRSFSLTYALPAGVLPSGLQVNVVTEGIADLDYKSAKSCGSSTDSTCTVNVTFEPQYAGLRRGAVQIVGKNNIVLLTTFIHGVGVGPQIAFGPGTLSQVVGGSYFSVSVDGLGHPYFYPVIAERNGAGSVFYPSPDIIANPASTLIQAVVADGIGVAYEIYSNTAGSSLLSTIPVNGLPTFTQFSRMFGGVAVDGAGTLFVADLSDGCILKFPAGATEAYACVPAHGAPLSVAVDAAGGMYIGYSGGGVGKLSPYRDLGTLVSGSASLYHAGLALNGAGDLFIADQVTGGLKLQRSQPSPVQFPPTGLGAASSPQTITIENIGNAPLLGSLTLSPGSDFIQIPGQANSEFQCGVNIKLAPGQSCAFIIGFTPTSAGSRQSSAILTDNSLNASGTLHYIQLSGVGVSSGSR